MRLDLPYVAGASRNVLRKRWWNGAWFLACVSHHLYFPLVTKTYIGFQIDLPCVVADIFSGQRQPRP